MKKQKNRILKALTTVFLAFLLFSCRISGSYEINDDGTGKGTLFVDNFSREVFLARMKEHEKFNNVKITSVDEKGKYSFNVNFTWDKFEDIFQMKSATGDGYVNLDLGKGDFNYKVKVHGIIDPERSSGEIIGPGVMKFSYGRGILVYKPDEKGSLSKMIFIAITVLLIYFLFFKKRT